MDAQYDQAISEELMEPCDGSWTNSRQENEQWKTPQWLT